MSKAMKRREIIDQAKQMVLYSGPNNILEFGDEVIRTYAPANATAEERKAILAEAVKQAERVYAFFGYEVP